MDGKAREGEEGSTMIVNHDVLRVLVPNPVGRCAMAERHGFWLKAFGFHEALV